ncbi:MAG: alginate export family protein [Gemmatimonadota bacterium]
MSVPIFEPSNTTAACRPSLARRVKGRHSLGAVSALCLGAGLAFFPFTATSQEGISLGGQLRTRYESLEPGSGASRAAFVSMRTRVHMAVAREEGLSAFVQFQDVRRWGEELSPLSDFDADHLDLHQAYAELRLGTQEEAVARVGRQEIVLGEERLLGSVDWTQQGQSLDGIRAWLEQSWGRVELFALLTREKDVAESDGDAHFLGAQLDLGPPDGDMLETYVLHDRDARDGGTRQTTLGARWVGSVAGWRLRGEGAFQTGTRDGEEVSAYLAALRLSLPISGNRILAELGYDHLSGDATPSEGRLRVFDTLYATNHKFYGAADLFLNIPRDTGAGGLQDLMARVTLSAGPRLSLTTDLHTFHLSGKAAGAPGHLGDELDLTARAVGPAGVVFTGGMSIVRGGTALEDLGRLEGNLVFGYVMMDVRF